MGSSKCRWRPLVAAAALACSFWLISGAEAHATARHTVAPARVTTGTSSTGSFCTNAKILKLAWQKYLEQPNPLDPQTLHARIFYSRKYLGRMAKVAPASIAAAIRADVQAYTTYDKSLALVGYDVVPESAQDQQVIHDALLAFTQADAAQQPQIVTYVKKACKVDLSVTGTSPTPTSGP